MYAHVVPSQLEQAFEVGAVELVQLTVLQQEGSIRISLLSPLLQSSHTHRGLPVTRRSSIRVVNRLLTTNVEEVLPQLLRAG